MYATVYGSRDTHGPSCRNNDENNNNKVTQVEISLFASKLKNVAGLGKGVSDPYAVVTVLAGNSMEKPSVLGRTEVIKNQLSPAWIKTFETTYTFGVETKFHVGVFDEVRKTGKAISMGSACFEIGEILGARGNIKAKKLRGGGTLFVRVTKSRQVNAGTLKAQFRGIKLKNLDGLFSKSDPFFVLSSHLNDPAGRTWRPVYRSEVIKNELNPVWEPFETEVAKLCDGNKDQSILIEVFDWEKSGKHQPMGSIQTSVNGLLFVVGGSDKTLALMRKNKSYGLIQIDTASITGEESSYGDRGSNTMTAASMAARATKNVSVGEQPQKFIKINGITKINPEYKKWKDAQGSSGGAASNEHPAPSPSTSILPSMPAPTPSLRVSSAAAPLPDFSQALHYPPPPTPFPPPMPPPTALPSNRTDATTYYGADNKPRFVDYIVGGTEINLVVAVDYTGSNGDPRKPGTLHYIHRDGQLNDYEKALTAVGSIVARYDSDQMFPVLGFGAKYNGVIDHCFQVGKAPELKGIAGMLEGYREVFNTGLTMSGPTVFAEVIDYAAAQARGKQDANAAVGEQSYTILLILTDGAVTDIEQTKQSIRNACTAPLSIVIVGIGSADFSAMRFLDDFYQQERSTRDIVQFVEFSRYKHDRAALTRETLSEIPDQLVEYFYGNKIMPLPPTSGSKINIETEDFNSEQDIDLSMSIGAEGEIRLADPAQATWDGQGYGTASRFLPPPFAPHAMAQPSTSHSTHHTAQSSYVSSGGNGYGSAPTPSVGHSNAYTPQYGGSSSSYTGGSRGPTGGAGMPYGASTLPAVAVPVHPVTVRIQAPPNSYPGMKVQVQHPTTGQFQIVTVPQGVGPGRFFKVQL